MRKSRWLHVLAAAAVIAAPVVAQEHQHGSEPPKMSPEQQAEMEAYIKAATPGPEHQALAAMAGNYDLKVKGWQAAGAPPEESTGTAVRSSALGGRVMVEEVHGTMMGMPFEGHGMTGFDNVTAKYWSTWNDNMGTGVMLSEGTCDAQKACTFTGSWNDPVKKGKVTARMTSKWTAPNVEVFEMYGPGKDGKEFKMMEITYTKK